MSRIYDALRRADLERRAQEAPDSGVKGRPEGSLLFGAATAPLTDTLIENIIRHPWTPSIQAIPNLRDRGEVIEQFRGLRSKLTEARREAATKTLLISSGMPSEGKSFVAVNLAVSLARGQGNRVLLIDGDCRRPTLHKLLGTTNKPGLVEYLDSAADLLDVMQQPEIPPAGDNALIESLASLAFIPAGEGSDKSSELLVNGRLQQLIEAAGRQFDWIIIDSPPVLAVTDAVDLARVADAVLLVAREAQTPFEVLQRAQTAFHQSRLIGIVLNAAKSTQVKKYHYSMYYKSYYGDSAREGNAQLGK